MEIPLFDLDGTLLKSGNKVHNDAFDYGFKTVFKSDASIREIVTHGKIDSQIIIEILALHGTSEEEAKKKLPEAMEVMVEYFMKHQDEEEYTTLPGVKELLIDLKDKGFLIGALTGNIEAIGWKKLENAGIRQYFDFGAFGNMAYKRVDLVGIARKEAEEILKKPVKPSDLVIVGDAKGDIDCAIAGGALSIGVPTGGGYTYQQLKEAGADLMVNSLEEKDKVIDFLSP